MVTLRIEHAVSDFELWSRAFAADPLGRKDSGVRRYRVSRPLDDPRYVLIDLDFDGASEAEAFRSRLEALWRSGRAAPALDGIPRARVVEETHREQY